jgi:hypothetical protein
MFFREENFTIINARDFVGQETLTNKRSDFFGVLIRGIIRGCLVRLI